MSTRVWRISGRVIGLFLLGVFLQWMGMIDPASQPHTLYSEIAQLTGGAPQNGSVAKLPPQQ